MDKPNKFYITNAIPYVNAKPHIGHAMEFVQSDTIARFHRQMGEDVLLLCGSDENALKNVQAAEEEKISVQELVDKNSKLFEDLARKLNVQFDIFQRGSDPNHHKSSQKLWELCFKSGDIYKKQYTGLYCVGCELFYEKNELNEKSECFEHPGKKLEKVSEENYFFKLSKYQAEIGKIIKSDQIQITPENRKKEVLNFIKQGLKDISISRSNKRAKNWGVSVPNDPTQKMYVWFDALNIYQSGTGFALDDKKYKKWWPCDLHVIGKGILRFHAIYWPAFLLSAGLALPKKIFVHEYITVNGQKMSKTLGNVIDPLSLIEKYGTDPLRYYFLRHISPFVDGDFSEDKFKKVYNSDLANGLGNLISRVSKLCENSNYIQMGSALRISEHLIQIEEYSKAMLEFRFNDALSFVFRKIADLDKFINNERPWDLLKNEDSRLKSILAHSVDQIQEIAALLEPFLSETAKKIENQFQGPEIVSQKPLFPRI
ncbi:MAG: methionine--tRNA ligase [Candidatus Levybacteria bacterium RIFCSPLOWO2_01_FULL_38_13]|nr:MAG: methionine--tRNA ligase [Candidatus Levybacteria bacterium RIFCSPHIGHO2_01_FULL_41_15]OGH34835.1 MAG: methionine--tRNA ligase [Candidatus Levybacteria bacterium RIFCSPLOWO2_01_FULL_38_13]